jgi:predicted Zn-dependent protease
LLPDPKDTIEEQNLLHSALLASDDGRSSDARAALEEVLHRDPKSPTALLQLGQLELSAGNGKKAAEYLGQAREMRPDDVTAAFDYARALELNGDLPHAREALESTLKLNPSQFAARVLMGKICLQLNDPKAAEDQLEAALLLQPRNIDAQLALAKAQVAQKEFSDAASGLEPLAKTQPSNPEVFELLRQAYSGLGKDAQAREAATKAERARSNLKSK